MIRLATINLIALISLIAAGCQSIGSVHMCSMTELPRAPTPYRPQEPALSTAPLYSQRQYDAPYYAIAPTLDGRGDDVAWSCAQWTEDFTDIEGSTRTTPRQRTRVKMLWNKEALFVLAELSETDLWATLKTHDEIVFQDNDFEIFVDPDGDTREYYEIEVNALGTIFDLYLPETYRAGTKANHEWNAMGMRLAIALDGTLNDSSDVDKSWSVEMELPWSIFAPIPHSDGSATFQSIACPPNVGDQWRINFSRVQWTLTKSGKSYAKVAGKPEDNWVWTPQWIIDMHVPQWWGRVTFVDGLTPVAKVAR